MSESDGPEIQIEISTAKQDVVDNTKRKDALLHGREIIRLGEQDDRFRDIIFMEKAFNSMVSFGMTDRSAEKSGALFGFHCGEQTIITRFVESSLSEGTAGTATITPEAWADLNRQNDVVNGLNGTDDIMVAWFHTHPIDYPPSPITTHDREIMSGYFFDSDKRSQGDKSTVIMTTYSGNSNQIIALWKWNANDNSALLQRGAAVAVKRRGDAIQTTYFSPQDEAARVITQETDSIVIDQKDFNVISDDISIVQDLNNEFITITLPDEAEKMVQIKFQDLAPETETIKISADDMTSEKAKILVKYLRRHPGGRGNELIRNILKGTKSFLPPELQTEVGLILGQTVTIDEQIKIIS